MQQKQKEVVDSKQQKEVDIRKLEAKEMQLDYDIESHIGDLARAEGILNSLRL